MMMVHAITSGESTLSCQDTTHTCQTQPPQAEVMDTDGHTVACYASV